MKASDPRYNDINLLQTMLCVAMNPHMHAIDIGMDDPLMLPVYAQHIKDELDGLITYSEFVDSIGDKL